MEQAVSAAEFVRAPVARWFATRTMLAWAATPSLGGFAAWGRPSADDARANCALFEGLYALPAGVDLLMDGSGIEAVDLDGVAALLGWARTHLDRVRARVRRRVGIIPPGAQGLLVAGLSPVLGWTADVSLAPDSAAALRELGAADPDGLAREVGALIAKVRSTPPLLAELRTLLRARVGDLRLPDAARALGVSSRTLQRELSESGSSFRAEELEARLDAALQLLESDAKIASIATRLGVTEGALVRLVRDRTGMSPTAYRDKLRAR
ncbi:MAG: AraC family transcriptional regulator [Polyangiaceae bacterium]